MEAGVTLLSEVEAPGSGASADDAAAFLKKHTQASTQAVTPPYPRPAAPQLLQHAMCQSVCFVRPVCYELLDSMRLVHLPTLQSALCCRKRSI